MKKFTLVIFSIFLYVFSFAQGHFVVAYTGNGLEQMNLYVITATIGGINLEAGDEIAAFDGSICCGKIILTEPIDYSNSSTYVVILASKKDGDAPNGYTSGNPILYRFWDSDINLEISGITAEYFDPETEDPIPAPTYSSETAVVKLSVATPVYFKMQLSVYIEGSYNTVTDQINTTLNTESLVPLMQPFNSTPWNYPAEETVVSIPADVVDWVLIEVRQATSPGLATSGTILARRAAFLKSNGNIVDLDGINPVQFVNYTVTSGNNLYPVIRHRNHLAVMSATGAILSSGIYSYDFRTGISQAYGGATGYKQIGSKFAMVAGDIDQDGNIFVSDYNRWAIGFGTTVGYFNSDLDMDGNVFVSDYNKWAINFGSTVVAGLKSAQTKPKYFSSVPK
jgi:hypothetical protein